MLLPSPGWYDSPEGAGQRFWDGASWTDRFREAGAVAATAPRAPAPVPTPTPVSPDSGGSGGGPAASGMVEYKVLTQKDRFFSGKFDPLKLEAALNSYAAHGWRVVTSATASIPSIGGARDEMVIVLERSR